MRRMTLAFCLVAALLFGCGDGNTAATSSEAPLSAAPALTGAVERAVVLSPADCEIIAALGKLDILVGRGEYCDYPAEALSIPMVQSGYETNIEQILALEPQVVFLNQMNQPLEHVQALEQAGVRVVVTDAHTIEEVYGAIRQIGEALDKGEEAGALAEDMKARLAAIGERTPRHTGGSVYFEVSPLEWGLWTAGSGTFMNEVAGLVGLSNIFSDVEGWAEISQEQVIERNPDYIITVSMYFGDGPLPEEEIMSREAWQGIEAVKNGNVMTVDNDQITRPGPRLADAAEELLALIENSR